MHPRKKITKFHLRPFENLKFESGSLSELVSELLVKKYSTGTAYHLVNAFTLVAANESMELNQILSRDLLLCDGKPLSIFLRRQNPEIEQVRGADLMREVLRRSNDSTSHFFLGSSDLVLKKLVDYAKVTNPIIKIAGIHSPPFQEEYQSAVPLWVEMVKESEASIVWVGLGTPKQDYVSHEIAKSCECRVIAIGAAFDYLAGNLNEAPKLWQYLYLEWLWRLLSEPKRLAFRYLIGNVKFIKLLVQQSPRKRL